MFAQPTSRRWFDLAACAVVVLLVVWQLFVPPALSVADDHDFEKILGHLCLGQVETAKPAYFDYTVFRYTYDPGYCIEWPMRTTNEAPFQVALWLDHVLFSKTDFDLRFMGAVYGVILMAGFVTLQRALRYVPFRLAALAQVAWVVVTCNAVYVPLFNTLYFDTLSLIALTGALAAIGVVALQKESSAWWIAVASFWIAALAGSKGQHAPLALLLLPVLWSRPRAIAIRALGTVAILAGAWLSMSTMPAFYQGEATFNALFYRILPTVSNPAAYLAETKIPTSWTKYSGEVAFAPDVPLQQDPYYEEQFGKWFGAVDLIKLYVRHPSAAWLIARENLDEASMDRVRIRMFGVPHHLGNYTEEQGTPPQVISHFFTVWAWIKDAIFGARPLVYLAWIVLTIVAAWALTPPDRHMRLLLATITLALAAEFAICMLDGADGGRHLTIFSYLLDLLTCADIALLARRLKPQTFSATR